MFQLPYIIKICTVNMEENNRISASSEYLLDNDLNNRLGTIDTRLHHCP